MHTCERVRSIADVDCAFEGAGSRPSANRNSELECRGPGTRSKIPARKSKIATESSCEGACFRKVFSALFRFDWPQWLTTRAVRILESCSRVCASTTQVVECSTSKQLPCVSLVAWSPELYTV